MYSCGSSPHKIGRKKTLIGCSSMQMQKKLKYRGCKEQKSMHFVPKGKILSRLD
jgi:hypothetical protein